MSCRIKNIAPKCGYRVNGVYGIWIMDTEDLEFLKFKNDELYDTCLVSDIRRIGDFIEIDTPDTSKYSSALQNGVYTHTIETFIRELSSEVITQLHLSTKRRYVVFFKTNIGRYFCFGYGVGATITYSGQTTDGTGCLMNISVSSIYPLFEVEESAFNIRVLGTEDKRVIMTEDSKNAILI